MCLFIYLFMCLFIYLFIYLFTILRAFPLYKAYMLGFGQVRRFDLKNFKRKGSKTMNKIKVIKATV